MDRLTPKQELFVQGIISGLSQRQAYRQAYKAEKMSDAVVDNKASAIFNKGEVRVRLRIKKSTRLVQGSILQNSKVLARYRAF